MRKSDWPNQNIDIDPTMIPSSHPSIKMDKTNEIYNSFKYLIDPNKLVCHQIYQDTKDAHRFTYDFKQLQTRRSTSSKEQLKKSNRCVSQKGIQRSPEKRTIFYFTLEEFYQPITLPQLSSTKFCVPLVVRHSPIAVSIVNHNH